MQNNSVYKIFIKKVFFNFSSESNLWKHIKIGLADSLKNKKFREDGFSAEGFMKYSCSLTMKDRDFVLNFDLPTFFKLLNKKKYIRKKKISYVSFYDLEAKKKIKKKNIIKNEEVLFKPDYNDFFCFYENEHEYYIDRESLKEELDFAFFFFDFYYLEYLGYGSKKVLSDVLIEEPKKAKEEKIKHLIFLKRTKDFSAFDENYIIMPDFHRKSYGKLEPVGEFICEDEGLVLSNFEFDYDSEVVNEFFHKSLDSLENFICSPSEPIFGFNPDNLDYEIEDYKRKRNLLITIKHFLYDIDSEIELKKSNFNSNIVLFNKKEKKDYITKEELGESYYLYKKIFEIISEGKVSIINKNFLGATFFFLLLMSLKDYTFYTVDTRVVETEEEYMRRMRKLMPYDSLSFKEEELEEFCEVDKKYHHPLYPLAVQVSVVSEHYVDKFRKREPVRYFIKDSFKAKKNKEFRANFKKNNKDFFFKKTYINKFNSYFFKKGNSLNTLKDLISGFSIFLDESLDRNIDDRFRTKNILAFFNMLASSENNININIILAWIIEFSGFIYFFKTKAVPKFLKKKIKKKYLVEPFFVKKEIRNKYTLKYFHFFTEKEQAFNLNDRFFDLLSSTAYDHKESLFYNYKVISLKKAIHKFLKNK